MIKRIAIAILSLTLMAGNVTAQQVIPFSEDDGKNSIFLWSSSLLRKAANNYHLNNKSFKPRRSPSAPVISTVNDPYRSSYGTWGQSYDDMWGLNKLNIEDAWKLSTGSGAIIAVLDTGVDYNHTDINDNIWTNAAELNGLPGVDDDGNGYIDDIRGWDFNNSDNNPIDDHGHGTHVAGIIVAEGNNGQGIVGVAYNSKAMSLKVFNSSGGMTTPDRIAAGIRYAVDMGARILSCSFGMPLYQAVIDAFKYAYDKGAIIIAAAGNDYSTITQYPAKLDYVVTVGSIGTGNTRSSFSNYGSPLDIVAPGEDILSLRAAGTNAAGSASYFAPPNDPNAQYLRLSGTSMATPFVSGLAALMYSQDPDLSFAELIRRLKFSSIDLGTSGWDQYYGWGKIDAFAALSHDWYDSGVIKTSWLTAPDAYNVIRYDYYETGETMSKRFASPDANNIIQYGYFKSGAIQSKWLYTPDLDSIIRYDYFISGAIQSKWFYTPDLYNVIRYSFFVSNRIDSKWLHSPDGKGNIRYSYYDESFNSNLGRIYVEESSSSALNYNYGFGYGADNKYLVNFKTSLLSGFGGGEQFSWYNGTLTDIISKRFEFDNGDFAEMSVLPGNQFQVTKYYYKSTSGDTAWFLWGNNVYCGYNNVVIRHTDNNINASIKVGLHPQSAIITPSGDYVYVSNKFSDTVSVIDASSNTVVKTISVGGWPSQVTITQDGEHVYVINESSNTISVIDTSSNVVVANINIGSSPRYIVMGLDGRYAYVTNGGSDTVSVIDTSSSIVVKTISVGDWPGHIAVTPDGRYVYITNQSSSTVSVIATYDNNVAATINVGNSPRDITISPNGRYAYITNGASNTIGVIDISNNTVVSNIPVAWPGYTAITPDGKYVYVASAFLADAVSVIDTSSNTVVKTISVGGSSDHVTITPDGKYVYIASTFNNKISMIETSSNSVVKTLTVGTEPIYMAMTSSGRYIYIVNQYSGNVTKIDREEFRVYQNFTPDTENPSNVINPANWTFIEDIANPSSIQNLLPELGDWWGYCFSNYIVPEFPALSSVSYDDNSDGRIDRVITHNDMLDTTYTYTWDVSAGTVLMDMAYDYDKDAAIEKVYSVSYSTNGHNDPSFKNEWTKLYEINYYQDGKLSRKLYQNGDFDTYYDNAANRIESKTLITPDSSVNIYYHYIDEFGSRTDKTRRLTIDSDGCLSHDYAYSSSTTRIITKRGYSDPNWTALKLIYTYYNNASNRLQSKTIASDNTYYHYMDEDITPLPIIKSTSISGGNFVFTFTSLAGCTYVVESSSNLVNWTTISPNITAMDALSVFSAPISSVKGFFRVRILSGLGYGRIDFQKLAVIDSDGAIAYKYTYGALTGKLVKKETYGSINITNPANPIVSTLKSTYTYYDNEANRLSSKMHITAGAFGNTYYRYIDEDWNSQGFGRVDKTRGEPDADYSIACEYIYYNDTTGYLRQKIGFFGSDWTYYNVAYTYYNNSENRMESKWTYVPDAIGNDHYYFIDENWKGQGYGRINKSIMFNLHLDPYLCLSYDYSYFDGPDGYLSRKRGYADLWTTLTITYTYYNNATNRIQSKAIAADNTYYHYMDEDFMPQPTIKSTGINGGNFVFTFTSVAGCTYAIQTSSNLVNWTTLVNTIKATGDLSTVTAPLSGAKGFFRVQILSGLGYGRVDFQKLTTIDSDSAIAYKYIYSALTGKMIAKEAYGSIDITDPANPVVSALKATYTYYDNNASRMQSKTITSDNICCLYSDEDWNGQGFGKLIRQTNPDGTYKTFESYFAGTNQARYLKEYLSTGILISTLEYDSSGALVSNKASTFNTDDLIQRKSVEQAVASQFSEHFVQELAGQSAAQVISRLE